MGSSRMAYERANDTRTRTVSITSGKGGVGKTTLVCNLALNLAKEGSRVLILDGDLGMANVDIMFNVRPQLSVRDLIRGEAEIGDVLMQVAPGVSLIPGGSGLYDLQNVNVFEKRILLDQVSSLGALYDYLLVDTSPGIDDNVLYLNSAAEDINVVITPDPASVADSYALIKVLNQRCRENRFSIICNQVRDEDEGLRLFRRFNDVAQRFLCVSLDYRGSIPTDPILRQATKTQQLVCQIDPSAPSSQAIAGIVRNIKGFSERVGCKGNLQFFWEQILGVA